MAKHTKMYKDSPKIEKDDEGKPAIKKGEKKAAEVNSGTADEEVKGNPEMDLYHKHAKERLDLHHKHEKEFHSLLTTNMAEVSDGDKTGGDEIKKVEEDKGE